MKIIKRTGKQEEFALHKVLKAVDKAFTSCKRDTPPLITRVLTQTLNLYKSSHEEVTVEGIQDLVENVLMEYKFFDVAKAYILYREKHKKIREFAERKIDFINNYKNSDNTANATIDDNSNVSNHNIAVLNAEIHKEDNQIVNLRILENKVRELYPDFDYKQMTKDFNTIAYLHDSSSQIGMPYCVAITMYPFLTDGIRNIGGLSAAPKSIDSFCGMFINLVFAVASQYKGAVATPGMLNCFDYFCRKEWGDNYYEKLDVEISTVHVLRTKTIRSQIHQYFQQIVYSLMQPSGSRGSQACFWNLSIFDKPFFDTMYGDFLFPDGTPANWESLKWLQKEFVNWLNVERLKVVLTFPVVSACLIYQDGKFLDEDMYDFVCEEYAKGNSFFTYISDSADSLSSCCRLSSKIEKPQFNFTNGQLSEMTGSKNVITLNLSRIVQDWISSFPTDCLVNCVASDENNNFYSLSLYLESILDRIYKYQTAYNECLKELFDANMLSVYNAGFINLKKQYLTIGINGLNQAAELLGMECNKNDRYKKLCNVIFSTIKKNNAAHKTKDTMFNTEFTPCESAAVKLYNRDKKDGYWVPNDTNLYASYIFKPNDPNISVLDKLYLHGRDFCGDNLDGGSAAHINLENHLSKEQYTKLIKYAAEVGCKYFTFNIPNSECQECGYITKSVIGTCPKCGSKKIDLWDRVIGYLTKIKNWSEGRKIEQKTRVYNDKIC